MMFKFKVGDDVRILKYKNIFAKGYTPNWSEAKLETQLHVLMLLVIKMVKKLLTFYEEELHKTNQEEFRIKNLFKRKGNKLHVKQKGYDNSFNIWIDKKDIV